MPNNELVITDYQSTEPTVSTGFDMVPVESIIRQTNQVKLLMQQGMTDGVHYGKIPGCGPKPTLLQPGAQKLMLMFGLADTYNIEREDLPNGHREYTVTCTLVSKGSGCIQGSGIGLCSTMEKKYRYRNVADYEVLDQPIPNDARQKKAEYRKQGYGMKKVNDEWRWVRFKDSTAQENPDIADTYNTVIKMASKRALIAAILNSLAVSDLFTQDVEEFGRTANIDYVTDAVPQSRPQAQAQPRQQAQPMQQQQAPQQQRPPQNDPLWKLRKLMHEAKELGIKVSDPDDPMGGLMGWIFATYGRQPQELTPAEIGQAESHVLTVIADAQSMKKQPEQPSFDDGFESEDIAF